MDEHPKLFGKLYVSMVRVGEEAGALPKVMADLAELLEHEDEVRSEVVAAVSYPVFVLGFGVFTVAFLLTVVLPAPFRHAPGNADRASAADSHSAENQRLSAPLLAWCCSSEPPRSGSLLRCGICTVPPALKPGTKSSCACR